MVPTLKRSMGTSVRHSSQYLVCGEDVPALLRARAPRDDAKAHAARPLAASGRVPGDDDGRARDGWRPVPQHVATTAQHAGADCVHQWRGQMIGWIVL